MNKKYELTYEILEWHGRTLHRIRALRDFGSVKAGDLGGWVQSERNLSHEGSCWLYGEAKAYDSACLYNNAHAYDEAELFDNAHAYDEAELFEYSRLSGHARLSGKARLYCLSDVYGKAHLSGNARASDRAHLSGNMHATRDVIYISGLQWPVTISDNHIKIGHEVHTIDEWAKLSDKKIAAIGPGTLDFWERWKHVIMAAAIEHKKEGK